MGRNPSADTKSTMSIQERLKQLKENQEGGWKQNLKKEMTSSSSLSERLNRLHAKEDSWKRTQHSNNDDVVTSSQPVNGKSKISDRLNSIISNSEKWKSNVGKQNDATQFTVNARIARKDGAKVIAPVMTSTVARRGLPLPVNGNAAVTVDDVTHDHPSLSKLSGVLKLARKGLASDDTLQTTEVTTTEVPQLVDKDFENFFKTNTMVDSISPTTHQSTNSDLSIDDNFHAQVEVCRQDIESRTTLSGLGHLKSRGLIHKRRKQSARNPLKALAARNDVKQSYTQQRSNVTKLEQQRLASVRGQSNFTSAALAGLAAKADLSKVNLRSAKKPAFTASDLQPWKDVMLLRVKGRRHVQTRLVEPVTSSLCSDDAYLLILPDRLFAWFGDYSNVIEKAKVQEIADYIIHKGDLGSKASALVIIQEAQQNTSRADDFWKILGGFGEYQASGGTTEDEIYEINAESSIKTYMLEESKLLPYQKAWGKLPTMEILSSNKTYVFDFGAEMYIWQGKDVEFSERQLAVKLAKTLWDQGYDYEESKFCPFLPNDRAIVELKAKRPTWGLFARVNENLETALVQEKFEDWSNIAREIGEREEILNLNARGSIHAEMQTKVSIKPDMKRVDVIAMRSSKSQHRKISLEGYDLWSGDSELLDDDGRRFRIKTCDVTIAHAKDKGMEEIERGNKLQFLHRADTYAIRWRYLVSSTGKWAAPSDHHKPNCGGDDVKNGNVIGRERVGYFLWVGQQATASEKGVSALLAAGFHQDSPSPAQQVEVSDGREPPLFGRIFQGGLVVVDGKRGSRTGFYSWKLFYLRGTSTDNAILYQIPCACASLRSNTSFVIVNSRTCSAIVWHGCRSPVNTRNIANSAAQQIMEARPVELGFRARNSCELKIETVEEGSESELFTEAFTRVRRDRYKSQLDFDVAREITVRAWHMTPSGDHFAAVPLDLVTKSAVDDNVTAFPYVQDQLEDLPKPALVILENLHGVFLWQSECNDEQLKGSAKRQHDINRRLAMETCIDFCKEYRGDTEALLVHEKFEPLEFSCSFPTWRDNREEIRKKIYDEQRVLKKPELVSSALSKLTRLTYSLEELRSTPLPEGVDPNHLETYLSFSDFHDLFQISKEQFYGLPAWKQQKLRKEKNLF